MRILHINEQSGWRGGEQQVSYLIRGLGARGHNCHLAGRPGTPFTTANHAGVVTGRLGLPLRGEADVFSARKIAAYARQHEIQILHAHTGHAHMIACLARIFGAGARVVVSRRVAFVPSASPFSRYKYSLPDHYVAISEAVARVLREYGIPSDKISVVHSGIDTRRLEGRVRSREELGLPESGRLVGNVAALDESKDHRTLVAAMPAVLKAVPDAHLVIAGEGPLRQALEAQSARLRVADNVHLLGHRDDVPALLKLLDVFALSSAEEGLGTTVLDAMACGVPVAATDAGGIPEMVRHEETGLLVPRSDPTALADAIVRLLRDEALAKRLAAEARTMVDREFSADAMVERNLAVYEQVLHG